MSLGFRSNRTVPAIPGTELKFGNGRADSRVVAGNGQINGYDKRDLMRSVAMLVEAHTAGTIDVGADAQVSAAERARVAQTERQQVQAAFKDRASGKWETIGSEIAMSISETGDRNGFARRLLNRIEVAMGQDRPRARIRQKQVIAMHMVGPSQTRPQFVRDNYEYMTEFDQTANVWVAESELYSGSQDIMDEKYVETQEAFSTAEDRYWKQLADQSATLHYNLKYLVGGLSLSALSAMRKDMAEENLQPQTCLMALSYWADIMENFIDKFDPVHQYEMFSTGELGSLLGLSFITDGFRHEQLRVLGTDEFYLLTAPEHHGCYSDRGPVQSTEMDGRQQGILARGWFMSQRISMAILNPRSIMKAQRA